MSSVYGEVREHSSTPDPVLPPSAPANITSAIQDPFGYGYEGRIAISRLFADRRAGIAAVVRQYAARSILAPHSVQYEYLICHGYYTAEELKDHPGCQTTKGESKETTPGEDMEKEAETEEKMREQVEHVAEMEQKRWEWREARLFWWRRRDSTGENRGGEW